MLHIWNTCINFNYSYDAKYQCITDNLWYLIQDFWLKLNSSISG